MTKLAANCVTFYFRPSYKENNSPKTRAFVKRDGESKTRKSEIANLTPLFCLSVGVALHGPKPLCDLIRVFYRLSTCLFSGGAERHVPQRIAFPGERKAFPKCKMDVLPPSGMVIFFLLTRLGSFDATLNVRVHQPFFFSH